MQNTEDRYLYVISNCVRFGCGHRMVSGQKQYFAFHGFPNRNDDLFTTAEISEEEYEQIIKEYPNEIIADNETALIFRNKYVENHIVIFEGWDRLF